MDDCSNSCLKLHEGKFLLVKNNLYLTISKEKKQGIPMISYCPDNPIEQCN